MGNKCIKEENINQSKSQTQIDKSKNTSKQVSKNVQNNQNTHQNKNTQVVIQKKTNTNIPVQNSIPSVVKIQKKVNSNEQREKKQEVKKKRQPVDQIQNIYYQICGQEQIMNDQKLFEFLGNHLGIADDDIVCGYITTNIMAITKIQKTPIENFKKLFKYCNATNVDGIKNRLPGLRNQIKNEILFKQMYLKLYSLYTGDHSTLDLQTAGQLWLVYLKGKLIWRKIKQVKNKSSQRFMENDAFIFSLNKRYKKRLQRR